ncbi:MAG: response regulator transcription factor [Pseudomonadales bacterium]|nr:response regulator transcription factor [Pseudomonadales bacterium]
MTQCTEKTVVLLVDDHPIYLDGISVILGDIFGEVEVLTAESADQAIDVVTQRSDIDWIFLDYKLPDCDGLALTKRLNDLFVTAPIIMMTGVDEIALVSEAIDTGVSGFIHKASGKQVFRECVEAIEAGNAFITNEQRLALEQYKGTHEVERQRILEQLSSRRKDVLVLIAEGYSNGEIAETLSISETTVKAHVSALISILEADNRYHCVAEARKLGII